MKSFKELNVKSLEKGLIGDKIKIDRILNKEIIVEDYKITVSKYNEKGVNQCLNLQFKMNNLDYILFTGSKSLIYQLDQIKDEDFPFTAIIIKENNRYELT
jgi:hypothetical protein